MYALTEELRAHKKERSELKRELEILRRQLQDAEANALLLREESTRFFYPAARHITESNGDSNRDGVWQETLH